MFQDKQVREINETDVFLEKSEFGTNRVYQFHRQLGGAFIDVSFQDEKEISWLYKHRIEISEPRLIEKTIKWDNYNFPYELETWEVGDQKVQVPFYREYNSYSLEDFLYDIAGIALSERDDLPKEVENAFSRILNAAEHIAAHIADFATAQELTAQERRAIDVGFNESSLFQKPYLADALSQYLYDSIHSSTQQQRDRYTEKWQDSKGERKAIFYEAESVMIRKVTKELEEHKFKKGFVSG